MKLKDYFPQTEKEAEKFDVVLQDKSTVFKIFKPENNSTLAAIEKTVNEVNTFLEKNGFKTISVIDFVKNDFNYESEDEVVSLSKHGYLEEFVLFVSDSSFRKYYANLGNDVLNLFKAFFTELNSKIKDKNKLQIISKALAFAKVLPKTPTENVFVNFEYEHQLFEVILSDYKIEFNCSVQDFFEDENGNKSSFETTQKYCFTYEIDGYTDIVGSFDEFRDELLYALKNVPVSNIYFCDEE